MTEDGLSPYLYVHPRDLEGRREQFSRSVFQSDRDRLANDLQIILDGALAPTCFSWWCVNLPGAVLGGQYQASLEALHAAHYLLEDSRAVARAKELLLDQAELSRWTDPGYGDDMGHDLASSHHCRGLAAGLGIARDECVGADLDTIIRSYISKVRDPYVAASYEGNSYLVGVRNTNWLAHLSGSVLIAELALAKLGREDKAVMALAKSNVLRYVDAIRPDGSLAEMGDYFHYGMEAALLSLHAWSIHCGRDLLSEYCQTGLRNALDWCLAFTDEQGTYWADFGDTHIGNHECSRTVGYLFGTHFGSAEGQWLGDTADTREPLAGLLRAPQLAAEYSAERLTVFPGEAIAAVNLENQHLAIRGGACRTTGNQIPHRHYDTGSVIYRLNGENVIADTGFHKYTETFWDNFDDPEHERSAPFLHNIVVVNGRGPQHEDASAGKVTLCEESESGAAIIQWQLVKGWPGLHAWRRKLILMADGPLCVIDRVEADSGSDISLLWHLSAAPDAVSEEGWSSTQVSARIDANSAFSIAPGEDHPKPYVSINLHEHSGNIVVVGLFAGEASILDRITLGLEQDRLEYEGKSLEL